MKIYKQIDVENYIFFKKINNQLTYYYNKTKILKNIIYFFLK